MRIAVAGGTGTVGRYVVDAVEAAGHEAVVLTRSSGIDLRRDDGLAQALAGVEVLIDTANVASTFGAKSKAFFTDVTARLQRVGTATGVQRLVTLSIVGIDRIPGFGYYQAKLAHEAAALAGPLPVTIVRATQFHEFPAQLLGRTRKGPIAAVPRMQVQSVAARSVGLFLVEVAITPPDQSLVEIAGPEVGDLVALARAYVGQRQQRIVVVPLPFPGRAGKSMRQGGLLPQSGARVDGPAFAQWLSTDDAKVPVF